MNQLTIVAYPPGAYGSFICWIIERFSKHRTKHQPAVTDNPLLPDGSSHAYASFCTIKGIDDFIAGMKAARENTLPWRTAIYAGWPGNPVEDINVNVQTVLDNMMPYDRMILVEVCNPQDIMLCYLRNESTLDRDRWFDMLGISNESQLAHRLKFDIEEDTIRIDDPRLLRINFFDILMSEEPHLWTKISQHLGWPMIDYVKFDAVLKHMRTRQERFFNLAATASMDGTAVQRAITTYYMEKENGTY